MSHPPAPSAILVVSKRQGTKPENLQLHARVALAAALWHSRRDPRLPIFHVAADTHGPRRIHDGVVVRALLADRYRVPAAAIHLRRWSLCTVVEVRAMRVLARRHRLGRILAVTHGYHAPRVASYLAEAGLPATVVAADASALGVLEAPPGSADLWAEIRRVLDRARPRGLDLARERAVEAALTALHRLDPRGRVERWLARRLRR